MEDSFITRMADTLRPLVQERDELQQELAKLKRAQAAWTKENRELRQLCEARDDFRREDFQKEYFRIINSAPPDATSVNWAKPIQLRNGRKAVLLEHMKEYGHSQDPNLTRVVCIKTSSVSWSMGFYREDGTSQLDRTDESQRIINVPS